MAQSLYTRTAVQQLLRRADMCPAHRALTFALAALLTISCGVRRLAVTPSERISNSIVSHLPARGPSGRERTPPSRPGASSADAAAPRAIETPENGVTATTAKQSPPSWSVTMTHTPMPPSTSPQPHPPGPTLTLRHVLPTPGRGGFFFLGVGVLAVVLVLLLLAGRRTLG